MTEKMNPLQYAAKYASWEQSYDVGNGDTSRALYTINFNGADLGNKTAHLRYKATKDFLNSGEIKGLTFYSNGNISKSGTIFFNNTGNSIEIRGEKNQIFLFNWVEKNCAVNVQDLPKNFHFKQAPMPEKSMPLSLVYDYRAKADNTRWHLDYAAWQGCMRGAKIPVLHATFRLGDVTHASGSRQNIMAALKEEKNFDWKTGVDFSSIHDNMPSLSISGEGNCAIFINWIHKNNPELFAMFYAERNSMFHDAPYLITQVEKAHERDKPPETTLPIELPVTQRVKPRVRRKSHSRDEPPQESFRL